MAGLLENPPIRSESSVSDGVPPSALPRVMDGTVYLPPGHPVEPDGPEFEALLRKNLPPEIAPEVVTNWRGVSARTSRMQWLGAVLFLLASAIFLYCLFPPAVHDDPVPHSGLVILDSFPALPFSSPYRSLYSEAAAYFKRGDYNRLCRILKPAAEEIVRTGRSESYALVSLYFKAVRKLYENRAGNTAAAVLLGELMNQEPDNPVWAQFHFELSPRIQSMLDYEQVTRRLRQNSDYRVRIRLHLHDVDVALRQLNNLRRITHPGKFSAAELKKYQEDYDLFEVKLLLSRWLLSGTAAGLPVLPDNEYDPGVFEREKALRIAMKHEKSSCEDFWLARLFIAKTLLSQDSMFNHIYWKGQYHTSQNALKREIEICEQRLNRRKRP